MLQCRRSFYIDLLLGCVIFSHDNKAYHQKTQIHISHNRLLGAVAEVLQLFLVFSGSIRIVLESMLKCERKLRLLEILL